MRLNSKTVLKTEALYLVPYLRQHVPIYHEWMQDPVLQLQTASERLSLEQEYEMQQTWLNDNEKLTFIIHAPGGAEVDGLDRLDGMIGDVNLFFVDDKKLEAELEIMIADAKQRHKGFGRLSCLLMMNYAFHKFGTREFIVKIGVTNKASIKLFTNLGFEKESFSDIFQEVTLKKRGPLASVEYEEMNLE